jgi:hypothetical protein
MKTYRLMPVLLLFAYSLTIIAFNSCGIYGFRENNPPEGIKSIAIPLFEDASGFSEAGVRETFTEKLKGKIISDNSFLITDQSKSDGIIYGKISSIKDDPLVISGNDNISKRKITVTVQINFFNLKTQKKIWEKTFENWGEYNSSSSSFTERSAGITSATEKICDDIINDLTSNW